MLRRRRLLRSLRADESSVDWCCCCCCCPDVDGVVNNWLCCCCWCNIWCCCCKWLRALNRSADDVPELLPLPPVCDCCVWFCCCCDWGCCCCWFWEILWLDASADVDDNEESSIVCASDGLGSLPISERISAATFPINKVEMN